MANTEKENDWRLSVPHDDLQGKMVIYEKFKPVGDWDHEHCEFCWNKFGEERGLLHSGYCTLDQYRWICEQCFHDFKDQFEWAVVDDTVAAD